MEEQLHIFSFHFRNRMEHHLFEINCSTLFLKCQIPSVITQIVHLWKCKHSLGESKRKDHESLDKEIDTRIIYVYCIVQSLTFFMTIIYSGHIFTSFQAALQKLKIRPFEHPFLHLNVIVNCYPFGRESTFKLPINHPDSYIFVSNLEHEIECQLKVWTQVLNLAKNNIVFQKALENV